MPERELVHQSERRTTKDRNLAAGLQRTTSAQFVELLAAGRVCTDSSGDEGMRKASTALLEQGTQTPSPAPDLIPAVTKTSTENLHWDWYSKRGHFRGMLHTFEAPRAPCRISHRPHSRRRSCMVHFRTLRATYRDSPEIYRPKRE